MAKKTITQRIALEGGDEIRKGLKELGDAGQDAFKKISDSANSSKFGEQLSPRIRQIEGEARELGKALRDTGEAALEAGKNLLTITGSLGAIGAALFGISKSASSAADSMSELAQSLGVSTTDFQRLQFALKQGGTSVEEAKRAFTGLADQIQKTMEGSKDTALAKLGIQVQGVGGNARGAEEVLGDIAEKFRVLPDGARKTALAMEIFGKRAGPQLIPFLNEGRDGIRALGDEAQRLGGVLSKEQITIASAFDDAFNRMALAFTGITNALGLTFAPVFTQIMDTITGLLADNREAIVAVATVIRDTLTPVFVKAGQVITAVLKSILFVLDLVAKAINATFGTNVTGQQLAIVAGATLLVAVFVKLATAIIAIAPILGGVLRLFTGITAIIPLISNLFSTFAGVVRIVAAAFTLLVTVFGAVPVAIALIIAALTFFLVTQTNIVANLRALWTQFWTWFVTFAQTTVDAVVAFFTNLPVNIQAAFQLLVDFFILFWTTLVEGAKAAVQFVVDAFKAGVDTIFGFFTRLWEGVKKIFNDIVDGAKRVLAAVKSATGGGGGAGGGSVAAAGGGLIRGPGSSTSDSIRALLSDGEYVVRAKAVDKYGAGLFAALNGLRIPLSDLGQRFASGGLVVPSPLDALRSGMDSILPVRRFADGGLATASSGGGGRPVNVNIGGETFAMSANDSTIERLQRFATGKHLRSAGRKPTWQGGR